MHVYNLHDTHRVIRIIFVVYMYRQIVCMCAKAAAAEFKFKLFKLFKFLHRHDFTEYHDLAPEDGWAPHDNGQNSLFLLPTTPHNSDNSI